MEFNEPEISPEILSGVTQVLLELKPHVNQWSVSDELLNCVGVEMYPRSG